jgi:carboxylesterase type B
MSSPSTNIPPHSAGQANTTAVIGNLTKLYNVSGSGTVTGAALQINSDTCVTCPTKELASLISQAQLYPNIDAYLYRYAGPTGFAAHAADLPEIFGEGFKTFPYNKQLSNAMMDHWLNFATAWPLRVCTSIHNTSTDHHHHWWPNIRTAAVLSR